MASLAVFAFSFVLRYNDPEGSFGGLTDDHFFYVVQGWQMLFGQLPDRDYFDPGAPLSFGIAAALQLLMGRSIWSEYIFDVTMLSLGAALTCGLAARVTGSTVLGVTAALFQIALIPRLYIYHKIIVYAVAVLVLWAWASAPRTGRTWLVALVAAIAFLLRHDHGVYVAATFALLLLCIRELSWRERVRHGIVFGFATLLLLTPYLAYLQVNGGVFRHFATAYGRGSQDDVDSALVLPTFAWRPLFVEVPSDGPASEWWSRPPFSALFSYYTWWMFWLIVLLPAVTLLLLFLYPNTGPPDWPKRRLEMIVVVGLAIILNVRFLRGTLAGRFAEVSVPMTILAAWSLAAIVTIVRSGRIAVGANRRPLGGPARALIGAVTLAVVLFTCAILVYPVRGLLDSSNVDGGMAAILGDAANVTKVLKNTWPLEAWAENAPGPIALARYLSSCTAPTDSVLVVPFLPQIAGLAQRAFAGGHAELRIGFYNSVDEQKLIVERLKRQSVPVVIGPQSAQLGEYVRTLPAVTDYLSRHYTSLGDKSVGNGLVVSLLVRRDARAVRTYEPLTLPCFR